MACEEYKALLPEYAEGSLAPDQVRLLRDHLPTCESCRDTVRLLKLDDDAIRKMLFGRQEVAARKQRRLYRSALFFGVVLALVLVGLYLAYRSVAPAEPVDTAVSALDRRVFIETREIAFRDFVHLLGKKAKVKIRVTDRGLEKLPSPTLVTRSLKNVTLREVLVDLAQTYGLQYRTSDEGIVLE